MKVADTSFGGCLPFLLKRSILLFIQIGYKYQIETKTIPLRVCTVK